MRTELKFFLNQDEEEDAKILIKAKDVYYALEEFKEEIRQKLKHGHEFKSADDVLEWVREQVGDILKGD